MEPKRPRYKHLNARPPVTFPPEDIFPEAGGGRVLPRAKRVRADTQEESNSSLTDTFFGRDAGRVVPPAKPSENDPQWETIFDRDDSRIENRLVNRNRTIAMVIALVIICGAAFLWGRAQNDTATASQKELVLELAQTNLERFKDTHRELTRLIAEAEFLLATPGIKEAHQQEYQSLEDALELVKNVAEAEAPQAVASGASLSRTVKAMNESREAAEHIVAWTNIFRDDVADVAKISDAATTRWFTKRLNTMVEQATTTLADAQRILGDSRVVGSDTQDLRDAVTKLETAIEGAKETGNHQEAMAQYTTLATATTLVNTTARAVLDETLVRFKNETMSAVADSAVAVTELKEVESRLAETQLEVDSLTEQLAQAQERIAELEAENEVLKGTNVPAVPDADSLGVQP